MAGKEWPDEECPCAEAAKEFKAAGIWFTWFGRLPPDPDEGQSLFSTRRGYPNRHEALSARGNTLLSHYLGAILEWREASTVGQLLKLVNQRVLGPESLSGARTALQSYRIVGNPVVAQFESNSPISSSTNHS